MKRLLFLTFKLVLLMGSLLLTVALSAWLTVNLAFVGREVEVPEITGSTPGDAESRLEESGLRLHLEGERHSEREPAGVIFFQEPLPGTALKKGRTVKALVSLGPQTVRIPRLAGREVDDAMGLLQEKGLRKGSVAWIHSLEVPENHVIAQTPEGGGRIGETQRIDLLVSRGPRRWRFVMPDLSGYPRSRVEDVLEGHGLRMGNVESRYVMGTRGGLVIGQYPPAGTMIGHGSTVSLVVSRDVGREGSGGVQTEDILTY